MTWHACDIMFFIFALAASLALFLATVRNREKKWLVLFIMHMPTTIHTKCALIKCTVVDLSVESTGKDIIVVELYQQPGIRVQC